MSASMLQMARLRARGLKRRMERFLPSAHEEGRIYKTAQGLFAVASTDTSFSTLFRRGDSHGVDEVERIVGLVPSSASVLIVGGHIGTLAIPISRHVQRVTVIEANPETFRYLSANVALNQRDNVELHEMAAGEAPGVIEFIASRENTGGSKRKPSVDDPRYYYDKPKLVSVDMHRLDDLFDGPFQAIVMDIEGSEYFALRGMPRILEQAELLFIEFVSHHLDNVAGVKPADLYDAIGAGFDHLFVPSDGRRAQGRDILPLLESIHAAGRDEDVIIFSKRPI